MNRTIQYTALGIAGMLASSVGFAAEQCPAGTKIFYTQIASKAALSPTKKSDIYKLTLSGVPKQVVWFTDRPCRKSGRISLGQFVKLWDTKKANSFGKVHPNGSFVYSIKAKNEAIDEHDVEVLELIKPKIGKSGTLTYTVKLLNKNSRLRIEHPEAIQTAALFVDSWNWNIFH